MAAAGVRESEESGESDDHIADFGRLPVEGEAADEAADPTTEMKAAGAVATSVLTAMREEARSRMAEIAAEKQRRRAEAETAAEKEREAECGEKEESKIVIPQRWLPMMDS